MRIDMKYIIRLICLFAVLGSLLSCNRWLDITPEDTTTEDQLFKDAGGYHSAINGLYQTLSSPSLYGENLTWGFLSALSQNYNNKPKDSDYVNALRFSYTENYEYASDEVRAFGEDIWQTAFNVIANANNILKHLESADLSIFTLSDKGEVDMIAGEAIAIRALLHFDLLRLFSVSPAVDMEAKAIPYVETFPAYFSDRLTNRQVLDKIIADLHKSEEHLAKCDTLNGVTMMLSTGNRFNLNSGGGGIFFNSRGARMNYFSVLALLSRVYLYQGNNEKAFEYAKKTEKYIRDADNWYFYTKRGFSAQDSEEFRPHKLIDELLIAFYDDELPNKYKDNVITVYANPYKLKNLSGIFKDADDYRLVKLMHSINPEITVSLKYLRRSEAGGVLIRIENRLIPIMRISEIHLILAECLAKQGKVPEAVAYLKKLRTARGCLTNVLDPAMSEKDFYKALDAEVMRENIAEGQYFFYCKRINAPSINNDGVYVPMEGKYTLEIPDSQTPRL